MQVSMNTTHKQNSITNTKRIESLSDSIRVKLGTKFCHALPRF